MGKVVIGTCWYRESFDTLKTFIKTISDSFNKDEYQLYIVIFIARQGIEQNKLDEIHSLYENTILLKHNVSIFPNKNFGVAAISAYANRIGAEYISVIDSDWSTYLNSEFLKKLFTPIVDGEADLIIPNNGDIIGRSNLLIGRPTIECFYKEYMYLQSPFPGYFSAKCDCIKEITSSKSYHFDWGGEWDIIRIAIEKEFRIYTDYFPVNLTPHRPNISKVYDGYQIWRAIISGITELQYYNFINSELNFNDSFLNRFLNPLKDAPTRLYELENRYNSIAFDKTEEQLLYMVIYPVVALCLCDYNNLHFSDKSRLSNPYDFNKLKYISKYVPQCLYMIFKTYSVDIKTIQQKAVHLEGGYWSNWNNSLQELAIRKIIVS